MRTSKIFSIRNMSGIFVVGILLFFLVGYILYPIINTVFTSFTYENVFSLENYRYFFTNPANFITLTNTLLLGFSTVLVCGLIGTALAFIVNYFDFPGRRLIDIVLLTPIMIPGVVIVIAFLNLYGNGGIITRGIQYLLGLPQIPFSLKGFWGILVIHAYTQYIYFYINVSSALNRLDNSLVEAAKNLGATNRKVFFSIIVPLLTPALVASSVLTFMTGVSSFAAPNLIGENFKVMSVQIFMAKTNNFWGLAAVGALTLSLVSITFLMLLRAYENRRDYSMSTKGVAIKRKQIKNKFLRGIVYTLGILLVATVLLPVITVFLISFVKRGTWIVDVFPKVYSLENYTRIFSEKGVYTPFVNSLTMALIATAIAVVIGVASSYVIVKTKFKVRGAIEILSILPWTLPASTIAMNLVSAFNRPTPFSFQTILVGNYIILPIGYCVIMMPVIVRSTNASLKQLHASIEEASRSLGATWFKTFINIVVPIVLPGILAGALLGFIGAVGDYTMSAFMYTIINKPISIAMISAMYTDYNTGLAMAYGVLQIILMGGVTVISRKITKTSEMKL